MILQQQWMQYPKDVREKLMAIFSIHRSSFVWVDGDKVVTDGVTMKDLEALTDEKLQDFSGISGTSIDMLEACIAKINGKMIETTPIEEKPPISEPGASESDLKCDHCEFIGKNIKSLRLHKIKKH